MSPMSIFVGALVLGGGFLTRRVDPGEDAEARRTTSLG